ncbi:MAG: hypothetical protein ABSE73_00070 [Planctomycetota bacterium]
MQDKGEIEEFEFGQGERLTVRLHGLIRNYPKGPGIIKEFIQNADDAGATAIRIILDGRNHRTERLTALEASLWAGPGMLVCNNAVFSQKDFEYIQMIGESSKYDTALKTGRFGVGFNVAYNVTDYPLLVSADSLICFDPHRSHPLAKKVRPGWGWKLGHKLWENYPDLLALFHAGGLQFGALSHPGTIFRLPLRTAEQARASNICSQPFTIDDFKAIVSDVAKIAGDLLLFLKHLRSLSMEVIEEQSSEPKTVLLANTSNAEEVQLARDRVNDVALGDCRQVLSTLRSHPDSAPHATYDHKISIRYSGGDREETWRVASGLYVDRRADVISAAEAILQYEGKALPWAGAAAKVELDGGLKKQMRVVPLEDGRLFCFLPLPRHVHLPVHLNGFFDLDSSRDFPTDDESCKGKDADRVKWNRCLMRHSVSQAYAALISSLATEASHIPIGYYAIWPHFEMMDGLLKEVSKATYEYLANQAVIRIRGGWKKLLGVWLPPLDKWPDLQQPLVAQGLWVPHPPIPQHVADGFKLAPVRVDVLTPRQLRDQLRVNTDLDVPFRQAPKVLLRTRKWLVTLLRFCLSDRPTDDLVGLPLALGDDGHLHTFGHSNGGLTILAGEDEKAIFRKFRHWFIDSRYAAECGLGPVPRAKIEQMEVNLVVANLYKILDPNTEKKPLREWLPGGEQAPNESWLIRLWDYLGRNKEQIASGSYELLRSFPFVPNQKGQLCTAGNALTPLVAQRDMPGKLDQALQAFDVPMVGGSTGLIEAARHLADAFINQKMISHLAGPDLADTLHAQAKAGVKQPTQYDPMVHDALLEFLADPRWEGKYTKDQLGKLSELVILPTMDGRLISARAENLFLPSGFQPPPFATGRHVLVKRNERWLLLLRMLNVRSLDAATFIREVLVPLYPILDEKGRLNALAWLQDNLTHIKRELTELNSEGASALDKVIKQARWVQCEDGQLRPPYSVYNPHSKVVRQVLGDSVPYPDLKVYAASEDCYLRFFNELEMQGSPRPEDILAHIDHLRNRVLAMGVDVPKAMLSILAHLVERWNHYDASTITDKQGNRVLFVDALKRREWLPAQRDMKRLENYYAAAEPPRLLCRADELYPVRLGHLVASQAPIADFPEPMRAVRDALGFPKTVPIEILLKHFDRVLEVFEASDKSDASLKSLRKTIIGIYEEIGRRYVARQRPEGSADGNSEGDDGEDSPGPEFQVDALRTRYATRRCLWDDKSRRFWEPQKTYQCPVHFLHPFRQQILIKTPQAADQGLAALGRRDEPSLADLICCLREHSEAAAGKPVAEDTIAAILKIYDRIGRLLQDGASSEQPCIARTPVLTTCNCMVAADAVFEQDTLRFEGAFPDSQFHLVHQRVDPGFIRAAKICRLSRAVIEHLAQEPVPLGEGMLVNACRNYTLALRTCEFSKGIQRLIQAEHGRDCIVDLSWLKSVVVRAVSEIHTTLTLQRPDGQVLSGATVSEVFVEKNGNIIYVADEVALQHAIYLAKVINQRLGQYGLRDGLNLSLIIGLSPELVDRALTKAHVPQLVAFNADEDSESEEAVGDIYEENGEIVKANDEEPGQAAGAITNSVEVGADTGTTGAASSVLRAEKVSKPPPTCVSGAASGQSATTKPEAAPGTVESKGSVADQNDQAPAAQPVVPESVTRARVAAEFLAMLSRSGKTAASATADHEDAPVGNPDRRREKVGSEIVQGVEEEPNQKDRSRVVERHVWEQKDENVRQSLLAWYGGKCQVCGHTFLKRDGLPYFEAFLIVPHTAARWASSQPGNAMCLCPTCGAKWLHAAVDATALPRQVRDFRAIREGGTYPWQVHIKLAGEDVRITYSERHMLDLQAYLREVFTEEVKSDEAPVDTSVPRETGVATGTAPHHGNQSVGELAGYGEELLRRKKQAKCSTEKFLLLLPAADREKGRQALMAARFLSWCRNFGLDEIRARMLPLSVAIATCTGTDGVPAKDELERVITGP